MNDLPKLKDVLPEIADPALLPELRTLIAETRRSVAQNINSALVQLYWQMGTRIHVGVLAESRAEYGKQIVAALGRQLEREFGRGFGEKNLLRMVQLAQAFPDPEIVAALQRQLSWTHFRALLPIEDDLKRSFDAEMCRVEGWSTRTLQEKINGIRIAPQKTKVNRNTRREKSGPKTISKTLLPLRRVALAFVPFVILSSIFFNNLGVCFPPGTGWSILSSRGSRAQPVPAFLIRLVAIGFWPFGRAKNVKEIGLSAVCGERKQAPRFDVSRWNYGVVIESMEGRPLLGVQLLITSVAIPIDLG